MLLENNPFSRGSQKVEYVLNAFWGQEGREGIGGDFEKLKTNISL